MERVNNELKSHGFEPITKKSVLCYYMPMKGAASFCVLGSQMISPELYENFRFLYIPRVISLTNACLCGSFLGGSMYMYSRSHMKPLQPTQRVIFSVGTSGVFNLGCVLGWALLRSVVIQGGEEAGSTTSSNGSVVVRALLGAAAAAGALVVARSYVEHVDAITRKK